MADLQKLIQSAIDERVGSGAETGVQVAVYAHGKLIVDAVAGLADPDTGRAVDSVTIVSDTYEGTDQVFGNPVKWGLGFSLGLFGRPDGDGAFGWGGAGGTFGYADTRTGVAFAMTKNLQTMDFSTAGQLIGIVADAS